MADKMELAGLLREASSMGRRVNALRGHKGMYVVMTGIGSPYALDAEADTLESEAAAEDEALVKELANDVRWSHGTYFIGGHPDVVDSASTKIARLLIDRGWRKGDS